MTFCWCPVCESEVVDSGGYCMLGHRLLGDDPSYRGDSPTAAPAGAPPPPVRIGPPTPPPPRRPEVPIDRVAAGFSVLAPARLVFKALESSSELDRGDPITAFAPAPIMDWGPSENRLRRAFGSRGKRPRMQQVVDA